jgi:putative Mg2+ transporter-C (MgtC) family protein
MPFPWQGLAEVGHDLFRLVLAYVLALPIGWLREREEHHVGLRTFPLVAVASCGYILLGTGPGMSADAQSRIIQGLVAGIGFNGGGAILKSGAEVHGTATAASIWTTGVIGAAVAQNRFILALVLSALNVLTLRVLLPIKARMDNQKKDNGPQINADEHR